MVTVISLQLTHDQLVECLQALIIYLNIEYLIYKLITFMECVLFGHTHLITTIGQR